MNMLDLKPLCCEFEVRPDGGTFFDINWYYLEGGGNESQNEAVETFFTRIGKKIAL
jgi:hypothetical protein